MQIEIFLLKFTCEKVYVFQKLFKVYNWNEMFLNVAFYQRDPTV